MDVNSYRGKAGIIRYWCERSRLWEFRGGQGVGKKLNPYNRKAGSSQIQLARLCYFLSDNHRTEIFFPPREKKGISVKLPELVGNMPSGHITPFEVSLYIPPGVFSAEFSYLGNTQEANAVCGQLY